MRLDPAALRLYLVADPDHSPLPLVEAVALALKAGATAVQLRAKHLDDRSHLALAMEIGAACREHDALFLVNDRVDIALLSGADGVHVGVADLPPAAIRRHLPEHFVIGYSPESEDDTAAKAADYLGIGPVFGTASKADAGAALGLDTFSRCVKATDKPVVGIGGINATNARSVVEAGACGVAMISAILGSPDISATTREISMRLNAES